MNGSPWRWPTSFAHPATLIGNGTDPIWHGSIVRCLTPSPAAARRLWAVIAISAVAALIRSSLTTPAATGTAPSVRETHAPSGWLRVPLSCCLCLTFILSSHYRMNYPHWCSRTSDCSTTYSSAPVPRPCLKWRGTQSISEPTSVYSVCFTPGDRTCNITLMSIASFLLAG